MLVWELSTAQTRRYGCSEKAGRYPEGHDRTSRAFCRLRFQGAFDIMVYSCPESEDRVPSRATQNVRHDVLLEPLRLDSRLLRDERALIF